MVQIMVIISTMMALGRAGQPPAPPTLCKWGVTYQTGMACRLSMLNRYGERMGVRQHQAEDYLK